MDLYEYQARAIFADYQVPVLPFKVADTAEAAENAAAELCAAGADLLVIKAQVKTGGRGKAGGVKLAHNPQEAKNAAAQILGLNIKGHQVNKVMVAKAADIAEEWYFSILLDRANRRQLAMFSRQGGVEIETLAKENPEALTKLPLDARRGLDLQSAHKLIAPFNFTPAQTEKIAAVLVKLGEVYRGEDALLVEVNPLVMTPSGDVIALDGKITLDDNARFRHPKHAELVDAKTQNPLERQAGELGLNYVKLDGGCVGVIGNGAGLVMSTLDVVAYAGEDLHVGPANFLDIGGGASAQTMAKGLGLILSDPDVRSVFVNVFGGITACDQVAEGIVKALEQLGDKADKPLVVRLDGNNVKAGREILAAAGHQLVHVAGTMDEGARMAAKLAAQN